MNWLHPFFMTLELVGTASFALSGAMLAIQKRTDFFGVLFLSVVTAVGGGIIRDILLGKVPPTAFVQEIYVLTALATGALVFCGIRKFRTAYGQFQQQVLIINNIFDAMGLGIFTVVGVQAAQSAQHGDNLFFCLFLGLVTGIGGGVLRDLMLQEIPFVLKKRIYAVASLLGSFSYWLCTHVMPLDIPAATVISASMVFVVRMLATKYQWNLPKAID